jgi:hypothetical protein
MDTLPCGGVGLVSEILSPYSQKREFYGWDCHSRIYKNLEDENGEWAGWKSGDEGGMRYNPLEHSLQVFHRRLGRVFGIYDIPEIPLYICALLFEPNSRVNIRAATEDDIREADGSRYDRSLSVVVVIVLTHTQVTWSITSAMGFQCI